VIPKSEPKKSSTIVSLGVVNGKATSLPPPPYPAAAKAIGANGAVSVQIMIDVDGKVISSKAVSGHPLLKKAAEDAARRARFSPTFLSKEPVKVTGFITYNFKI
jgi:protein TonB